MIWYSSTYSSFKDFRWTPNSGQVFKSLSLSDLRGKICEVNVKLFNSCYTSDHRECRVKDNLICHSEVTKTHSILRCLSPSKALGWTWYSLFPFKVLRKGRSKNTFVSVMSTSLAPYGIPKLDFVSIRRLRALLVFLHGVTYSSKVTAEKPVFPWELVGTHFNNT